ncbi:cmgc cdk cdk7 protein kinase [Vairimorpha apis BRL 01]|uniref:[RNA-polymerase]-subunit kinase n=1 Tax=Vairimorpha apis BRL 01 TaxID=1037528 RepID=T0L5C2_9MICR|nr:cmgc cdk cdk7 protein kinase [Vairimorpha apis BRL 01]
MDYIKKKKIGEGTYATIYLASKQNIPNVAIKRMKKTKYSVGHDISVIREIKTLKQIKNKYILDLIEIYIQNDDIHLVLEYVETDLECIINNKQIFILPSDVKSWMLMILTGVHKLHEKFILHRDIKPNNILVSRSGLIKIADFGLSRSIGSKMTSQVVTRWYRAPELLLGAKQYGFGVDMWSIGCIFAELMLRVPLFAGESDLEQLNLIFKVFGTPKLHSYPSLKDLPGFMEFQEKEGIKLESLFTAASIDALSLLKKFFIYDPNKRINTYEALNDNYFSSDPKPTQPKNLPFFMAHE